MQFILLHVKDSTLFISGNLEWKDKTKKQALLMWRTPEQWGKLIYDWVGTVVLKSLHTPSLNSVFSCFESEQIKKWASQSQEQILWVLLSISK